MEKETKTKEKTITVGNEKNKVFCKCGEKMEPTVMSYSVQYRCPMMSWFNFMKHSLPKIFTRKEDEIGFTIETSLEGLKEIAEGLEEVLKKGESVRKGDTIQFNYKGKTFFDIKLT